MDNEWREVIAEWEGEEAFTGKNARGGSVQMGMLQGNPGISPMEMLLLGAAGCTGTDIVSILRKCQQDLVDLKIKVRAKRADEYPRVWKEIEVTYLLWGNNLDVRDVERAIRLSEDKYCAAGITLRAVGDVRTTYKILAPGESTDETEITLTIH